MQTEKAVSENRTRTAILVEEIYRIAITPAMTPKANPVAKRPLKIVGSKLESGWKRRVNWS